MRTWCAWFQVVALATTVASGCVENDEKKAAPPPPAETPPAPPPEPARATIPIDPATAYAVATALGANKCLQFGGGSKEDIAPAEMAPCNGSKAQQFNLQTVPGGYYALINANSGKCLDVSAYAMTDGALVQQYQCNGGANQNWIVAQGGAGAVRLVARHSGKALTIQEPGDAAVGKVTQQASGSTVSHQLFRLKGPNVVAEGEAAGGHKGKDGKDGAGGSSGKKGRKSAAAPAAAQPAKKQP